MSSQSIYASIIEALFLAKFTPGSREVEFAREEMAGFAAKHQVRLPKNLGDLVYSFRCRTALPASVQQTAPPGQAWIIRSAGRARDRFALVADRPIVPNPSMTATKVPDATPGIVAKYALSDEQALLAKVRYNRLVDIFTGVACYSLQDHLRTTAPGIGQVETNELYVGISKNGTHYAIPVQATGGASRLNIVQIEQDIAVGQHQFPSLVRRPVGAQFLGDDVIALFEFEPDDEGLGVASEKHYRLVAPEEVSDRDLEAYRLRTSESDLRGVVDATT